MSQLKQFEGFTEQERRTLVLAMCYERTRRTRQFGYRVFGHRDIKPEIISTPLFKTLNTVREWLDQTGWKISWSEVHWQGYIRFCFERLAPTIPMPGQLKNKKLLRLYLASAPDYQPPERSQEEMEAIYRKVLRPEINTTTFMAALGLRERP